MVGLMRRPLLGARLWWRARRGCGRLVCGGRGRDALRLLAEEPLDGFLNSRAVRDAKLLRGIRVGRSGGAKQPYSSERGAISSPAGLAPHHARAPAPPETSRTSQRFLTTPQRPTRGLLALPKMPHRAADRALLVPTTPPSPVSSSVLASLARRPSVSGPVCDGRPRAEHGPAVWSGGWHPASALADELRVGLFSSFDAAAFEAEASCVLSGGAAAPAVVIDLPDGSCHALVDADGVGVGVGDLEADAPPRSRAVV